MTAQSDKFVVDSYVILSIIDNERKVLNMGLLDRSLPLRYDTIAHLGRWYVRRSEYGHYYYMVDRYTQDGKPMWCFDIEQATQYDYETAHDIVRKLKGE